MATVDWLSVTRRSSNGPACIFCLSGVYGEKDGSQLLQAVVKGVQNMTRLIASLALASFSIVASAAEKPLPVTVTNPVLPVEVSNADPIPVAVQPGNAVEPGYAPYQRFEGFNQGETYCTQFVCTIEFDAVPAGMRLVVTHLMGFFAMAAPNSQPTVSVGVDGSIFSDRLRIPASVAAGSGSSFHASAPITFFIEAGHRPTVFISGDNVRDVSNTAQVGLAGYLVKL